MLETRAELHPHQALETKELREQIDAAIALVPDVYRVVVTLASARNGWTRRMRSDSERRNSVHGWPGSSDTNRRIRSSSVVS